MVTINNDISFTKEFINQLVPLIPKEVHEFWKPKYSNTGLVRFDKNKLDAVYITSPSIYGQHNLIKFNVVKDKYIFDSVYSHYDVITKKDIHPWEHRYDKDLNVLATYKFAESEYEGFLSIQYKGGKKLKEYLYQTDPFQPEVFRNLWRTNTITFKRYVRYKWFIGYKWFIKNKIKNIYDINCLRVNGNEEIVYYWIR